MANPIFNEPQFQDADAARDYLESVRWANGIVCPHCGVIDRFYKLVGEAHRPGLYKCSDCLKQFSVTVGTVFERSKIALHIWLQASHLMCSSKKGISAKQLERTLGVTYKTAWFMAHRIRKAMEIEPEGPLGGGNEPVEVDETFWGNKGKQKPGARSYHHTMKIFSLVERNGEKRSFHVPNVSPTTLRPIMKAQLAAKTCLMTDEAGVYKKLGKEFGSHYWVTHGAKEYVRGHITTNTVESSFALLKRGLVGTFHSVSEQHLQRYATEFDFRWNTRQKLGFNDVQRTEVALKNIAGKRLTYN